VTIKEEEVTIEEEEGGTRLDEKVALMGELMIAVTVVKIAYNG